MIEYSDDKLIIERFSGSTWTPDLFGTIRTKPENYYVASIMDNGMLLFDGIEANTRNFPQDKVKAWYNNVIRMPNRGGL